jgi:glycosyltransferase involved in cell wall biosynthesis
MSAGGIGLVVKTFPKLSETFILGEILGLERMGLALEIFSLRRPGEALRHGEVSQVRARVRYLSDDAPPGTVRLARDHAAAALRHPLRYLRGLGSAFRRKGTGWSVFVQAVTLARMARRAGVTHLHAHFASESASVAELAAQFAEITYSISAHAKDIYTTSAPSLRRKLRGARFTVTCTECNRAHLGALAGPDAQVFRMYHGIDLERFSPGHRPPANPPLLLSVGRLREKKGFATLIRACALLRDRDVPFRCEIVGYGEDRLKLQGLIRGLAVEDRVVLAGTMNHEQLIHRYRDATLFALPCEITPDGDRDGIPNVLLEAMATELPVVATTVSGIPEVVVHEDNGLLVPPQDAFALAGAMQRLIADASLRARLGAGGRRTVARLFRNEDNLKLVYGLLSRAAAGVVPAVAPGDGRILCAGN